MYIAGEYWRFGEAADTGHVTKLTTPPKSTRNDMFNCMKTPGFWKPIFETHLQKYVDHVFCKLVILVLFACWVILYFLKKLAPFLGEVHLWSLFQSSTILSIG